jgi:transposase
MSRLRKYRDLSKGISLSEGDLVVVGLDVHRRSHHMAVLLNGEIVKTAVVPSSSEFVARLLEPFRVALVNVVYEAGPTGYGLARKLEAAGYPVMVVAPSKTPRESGRTSKSDRLDCRRLAQLAAGRMLRPMAIPTEQEEMDRQVCRLRDQLSNKLRRVKQQIKSLLLQYGIEQPSGLSNWSKSSVEALQQLELPDPLAFCLQNLSHELVYLQGQIKQVAAKIKEVFEQPQHQGRMALLQTHPGVGPVTASHFCAELFRPERFRTAGEVTRYLGLCPRVSQSGERRREGPLLKTGRRQLRAQLIEAAWIWRRHDPTADTLYRRLLRNTGQSNKAIAGVARHLAIHLWRMLCRHEPYRAAA